MADGFLGRWSQRKQAVRAGQEVQASPESDAPAATSRAALPMQPAPTTENGVAARAAAPLPTLEDVQRLTPASDFAPFVARGVAPQVRNAAMKKLFSDPHYNVMDRLDIYIDDYAQPDPLPLSMLRQMASAKFLNLFEEEKTPGPPVGVDPPAPAVDSVAQSGQPSISDVKPSIDNHDHPDLRLQPNHAAGRPGFGGGAQ